RRLDELSACARAAQRIVDGRVVDDHAAAGDRVRHLGDALAVPFHYEGAFVTGAFMADRYRTCFLWRKRHGSSLRRNLQGNASRQGPREPKPRAGGPKKNGSTRHAPL